MGKILATIVEKIKRGMEIAISACINQLIKLKEWLKRVKNGILNKLLVKISSLSLEGSTQQLEERMKELGDSLPSEKGKDAKAIFDFISKSSKEDLEKIAILAETAKSIEEKDVRAVFDFISKSYREDLEKITTFVGTTRSIQEKDAEIVLDFISKAPKEKLERVAKILGGELEPEKMEEKIKKMRELGLIDILDDELDNAKVVLSWISKTREGNLESFSKMSKEKIEESLNRADRQLKIAQKYGYTDDEIEKLREDFTILKWFLKPDERDIHAPTEKLEKIREEEKEAIYRKITLGDIEEIEELTKLNIGLLFHTGCELLRRGEFKRAYENFDYITKRNVNLKGAWLNKGFALGSRDKYEDEIKCYDKAIKIDEKYASAWYNKGIALKNLNRDDEAEECFERAKEINPGISNLVERSN